MYSPQTPSEAVPPDSRPATVAGGSMGAHQPRRRVSAPTTPTYPPSPDGPQGARRPATSSADATTTKHAAWIATGAALVAAVFSLGGALWGAHMAVRSATQATQTAARSASEAVERPMSKSIASTDELTLSMEGTSREQIRKAVLVSMFRSFTGVYLTLVSIIQGAVLDTVLSILCSDGQLSSCRSGFWCLLPGCSSLRSGRSTCICLSYSPGSRASKTPFFLSRWAPQSLS